MDPDFLARLRQIAATGQAPPRPSRAGEAPFQPIHEQLLASLQERTSPASPVPSTYVPVEGAEGTGGTGGTSSTSTGPPQGGSVQPLAPAGGGFKTPAQRQVANRREQAIQADQQRWRDAQARRDAALDRVRKGAIEQILREDEGARAGDGTGALGPAVVAGPPTPAPRGVVCDRCDGKGVWQGRVCPQCLGAKRVAGVVPIPTPLNPLRCPICEGRGFLTVGETTRMCGRCGGEGYVPDPRQTQLVTQGPPPPHTEEDVPLPCEPPSAVQEVPDGVADVVHPGLADRLPDHGPDVVAAAPLPADALADEGTEAETTLPSGLTYDLPTSLDHLPPFCFICGPAGVGKTFQAKAWLASDPEGVVLAATTGIAAVNLGEGTTINSFLKFYDTASLTEAFTGGWLESQLKRQRHAGLRRIVLDETSMLDGDQLTILCRAIDNVNQDRGGDDAELGLVLVGDFAQLPPVRAPFAFESAEWPRFAAATYGLTTIRRQADQQFIEALQAVRRGAHAQALEYFAPMLQQTTNAHYQGTTILAKNDAVEKFNLLRLDKVPGKPIEFGSQRWGKLRSEWGGPPKPPYEWGVPETLKLKEGALVMILANRNIATKTLADPDPPPEYLYVNGDLGEVVSAEHGTAHVVLQRTGEPVTVIPITRENLIPLEVGRRKALKEEGHPERISANGKSEVIGACSYMPLRLAYASTVHKSQGLSLDAVQVSIRDHFFSTPGMLYVALSRARTAEGLRLVGSPESFRARCTVSHKVQPWL